MTQPLRILLAEGGEAETRPLARLAVARGHEVVDQPGATVEPPFDVVVATLREDRDLPGDLTRWRHLPGAERAALWAVGTPPLCCHAAEAGVDEVFLVGMASELLEAALRLAERRTREARARAEDRALLAKAHADLVALVENTTDYVLFSDKDGNPLVFNSAYARVMKEVLGIEMRPGLKPHELLPEPDVRAIWDGYHRRVLSGEHFAVEYAHTLPDDDVMYLEVRYMPVVVNGAIVGFSEFTRDITEQKRASVALRDANERLERKVAERTADLEQSNRALHEQIEAGQRAEQARREMEDRLRQAEKLEAIGQLAGGVAHDFNNQLVGILGGADMLLLDLKDDRLKDYAQLIRDSAQRSSELVGRLLAFARRGPARSEPLDVHRVVRDAEGLVGRALGPGVKLHLSLGAESSVVAGDEGLLHHAVLNLLVNAAAALPDGGGVEVSTSNQQVDPTEADRLGVAPGRYVSVRVADDGIGMDEHTLARAFDPFFTTKPDGTGLGLAGVRGTIERHAGTIRAESQLGVGTQVEVLLPTIDVSARRRDSGIPRRGGPLRVLLVDDEESVRAAAGAMLRSLGHEVFRCADGQSAIDWFEAHRGEVDVVLLDVVMPGLSGVRTAERIREMDPKLPLVLMSGYSADGEVERALAQGVAGFVPKPFTLEQLERTVAASTR